MAELRHIFRDENGDEWHAWMCRWGGPFLYVTTVLGVEPILINVLKSKIEGPYKVWMEKRRCPKLVSDQ